MHYKIVLPRLDIMNASYIEILHAKVGSIAETVWRLLWDLFCSDMRLERLEILEK